MNQQNVQIIFDLLHQANYECYLVGGAVRDFLLQKEPNDYDFATNAAPNEIKAVFQNYQILEYGKKHGTITVLIQNIPYEITTYRIEEEYIDHRHPTHVSFSKSLKEDLLRRDFTINALAYTNGKIIDFFHGIDDLNQKRICAIGNPHDRFEEDALRIMRCLRFACQLQFMIEEKTSLALLSCAPLLKHIAMERVIEEIRKMVVHPCGKIIREFSKVFVQKIPFVTILSLEKTSEIIDLVDEQCDIRLATFFYPLDHMDLLEKNIQVLKLSCESNDLICTLYKVRDIKLPICSYEMRKLLHQYGIKKTKIILSYICSLRKIDPIPFLSLYEKEKTCCFSLHHLKLKGNDLIQLGITDGKLIREYLNWLLNEVMLDHVQNDQLILKEHLLKNL